MQNAAKQNAYLLAKIGADTAENEQHFADTLTHFSPPKPRPRDAHGGPHAEVLEYAV